MVKHKGNVVKGKFLKSEDIRRRLRRELRDHHRHQDDLILGSCAAEPDTDPDDRPTRATPNGRQPILARYVKARMPLRAKYKGKWLKASVRKNGLINFGRKIFTSPSRAGQAATKRVSCNGWKFWTYEQSPGGWVLLENLRK
jgi:hypothetical protein